MEPYTPASLIKFADQLFNSTERSGFRLHWGELADYLLPTQSGIFNGEVSKGGKKTSLIFDGSPGVYNATLARAMQSTLTNPATQWSVIRHEDDDLNNNPEAVDWLEDANKKIARAFDQSNFNTEVAKFWNSYVTFGNGVLVEEEKGREGLYQGLQFKCLHLAETAWSENLDGSVDRICRRFKLKARQAVEKFDNTLLAERIIKAMETNPEEEFPFLHCIYMRPSSQVMLDEFGQAAPDKRPVASMFVDETAKAIVEEGGYYEFPAFAVRWDLLPLEVYGRGPGTLALPDVKTLNTIVYRGLQALDRAIDPAYMATQRNLLGSLDLRPGRLNVVKDMTGLAAIDSHAKFDVQQYAVEDLRNRIKETFFLDKLMLPPRQDIGPMTAYETSQRVEEMQRVLGPVLGRLNVELLSPLVVRTFQILFRAGMFKPLPQILKMRGVNVKIEFLNSLARSQQMEIVNNINTWLQHVGVLAQVKPEILDYINGDEIVKITGRIQNVPESTITNDDEVAQVRDQRAKQQQAAMSLEAGVKLSDMKAKSASADGKNARGPANGI